MSALLFVCPNFRATYWSGVSGCLKVSNAQLGQGKASEPAYVLEKISLLIWKVFFLTIFPSEDENTAEVQTVQKLKAHNLLVHCSYMKFILS